MKCLISHDRPPRITISRKSVEPVRFAAAELARYLGRILDVKIVVGPRPRTGIPETRLTITPDAELTDEGYCLSVISRRFVIAGGGAAGVVYGVYEFLRRYAGCSFAGLAPEGEYVPQMTALEIPAVAWRNAPRLWYRGLQFSFLAPQDLMIRRLDWMAKNGMNYIMTQIGRANAGPQVAVDPQTGAGRLTQTRSNQPPCGNSTTMTLSWFRKIMLPEIRKRGLKWDRNHHNLRFWLPPEKYFQHHPNWYALKNGRRTPQANQLAICTSNKQAVAELTANILAFLRANPSAGIVGVIPEDGIVHCKCEQCRRLDMACRYERQRRCMPPCGIEYPRKARRYALLVNAVARVRKIINAAVGKIRTAAAGMKTWPEFDGWLRDPAVWLARAG